MLKLGFWLLLLAVVADARVALANRRFVDTETRQELYFHGVNVVVKGPPYLPLVDRFDLDVSMQEKDFEMMQELGLNSIRLGMMWPGVEPEEGKVNETYLEIMQNIVETGKKYGVYSLLDMHQDDFSEHFCGEGVPTWAYEPKKGHMLSFPWPVDKPFTDFDDMGLPTRQVCAKHGWPNYQASYAIGVAYQKLYDNTLLRSRWIKFWTDVTKHFKGVEGILGMELINEPFAGNVYLHPTHLLPSVADRKVLQGAYDAIAAAIREIDDEVLLYFESVTWDDIIPVGFQHAPGGDEYANRSVLAPHFYVPPQKNPKTYLPRRLSDSARLGTGIMLTEFERPDGVNRTTLESFDIVAAECDEQLISWMMWEWKTFCIAAPGSTKSQFDTFGSCKTGYGSDLVWDSNGNENKVGMKQLARTYAYAVSGRAKTMKFDPLDGSFSMQFTADPTIEEATMVFAHQDLHYPNGMTVNVDPPNSLTWTLQNNRLAFSFSPAVKFGDSIKIEINAQ